MILARRLFSTSRAARDATAAAAAFALTMTLPAGAAQAAPSRIPDVVPKADLDAGRSVTSAAWLRDVSEWHFQHGFDRGVKQGWDAFPQWKQFISDVQFTPTKNTLSLYQVSDSATLGRLSGYEPGTRFTLSWHRCDGTLRAIRSVTGKGQPITVSLPPSARGHVVEGTYVQTTVTAPGKLPVAEHGFTGCGEAGSFAKDATGLVHMWGEKLTGAPKVGTKARISKAVKTKGGAVTRTWYVDGKPVARNARRFVPKAGHVGKRLTVKVKVSERGASAKHTFVLGRVRAAR